MDPKPVKNCQSLAPKLVFLLAAEPDDVLDRRVVRVLDEGGVGQRHAHLPQRHLQGNY